MAYSMQQANDVLATFTTNTTKEQLLNLINQLDVSATGAVTVLYSGPVGDGIHSSDIIKGMLANGENIRVIDETEAAKFLNVDL